MAPTRHLVALAALAVVASLVDGRQVGPQRMNHQRRGAITARQNGNGIIPITIPGQDTTTSRGGGDVTDSPAAAVTTTSSPPPVIQITVSSSPAASPTTSSVAPVTTTISSTILPSSTARSTVKHITSLSTVGNSIVNVTLTSTIDNGPSSSASAIPAVQDNSDSDSSSGIGKGTLIAIVVVASSCAGVFILWTIFRRWKLKPTRNFEERLQPIDFGPGEKGGYEAMESQTSLNRNGSLGSNGSGEKPLARRDSFGSAVGSQRGGPAGSVRGGVAPSESGSRVGGYAPSYPPSSNGGWNGYAQQVPAHQLPYNAPSPPRLANPYGSDYGATHGLARSDTVQSSQYGGSTVGGPYGGRYT